MEKQKDHLPTPHKQRGLRLFFSTIAQSLAALKDDLPTPHKQRGIKLVLLTMALLLAGCGGVALPTSGSENLYLPETCIKVESGYGWNDAIGLAGVNPYNANQIKQLGVIRYACGEIRDAYGHTKPVDNFRNCPNEGWEHLEILLQDPPLLQEQDRVCFVSDGAR